MARSSSRSNGVGAPVEPSSRQNTSSRPRRFTASIRIFWPLSSSKRAGQRMRWLPSRHAQLARQLDQPVGAHDGGIEAVEVDAGWDGLQPAVERREALQRIARHVLGHGDHRIGARLAALDEALGDAAGEEGRVQGRDPLDAESPRQRARHPGGVGRARLDQRDARFAAGSRRACRAASGGPTADGCRRGSSRCVARCRSRSGTMAPPGEATMAEPPAAMTACAASSVARAEAATGEGRNDLQEGGGGGHVSLAEG